MARSPEWNGHCRYADVMQHFSKPVIATNEEIIIWAVLGFEEEEWVFYYYFFTIYGQDCQCHIELIWSLVEIGQVVSEEMLFNNLGPVVQS